jgi:endonuclease-3 related protein
LTSYDLFEKFEQLKLLDNSPLYWWPNYGSFEVLIGAVLTQNTKWENVEYSLDILQKKELLSLEAFANIETNLLASYIQKSGFKNQKAQRLKRLCSNILEEFGDFDSFCEQVWRDWLLEQKGIGQETCDAILCYACRREVMVVDSYTFRILQSLDYEYSDYLEIQEWLEYGINENYDKITKNFQFNDLNLIYARFHGGFVEFCKLYCKRNFVDKSKLIK